MIRVGISGWNGPEWRGQFYPASLAPSEEVRFASRVFNTLEVKNLENRVRCADDYRRLRQLTPDRFLFSVHGCRKVSQAMRRKPGRIKDEMAKFFSAGVLELGEKLGPILWRIPKDVDYIPALITELIHSMPKAALGPHGESLRLRYAIETQNSSFHNDEFLATLKHHNIAWVIGDKGSKWPAYDVQTADFSYVRMHCHQKNSGVTDCGYESETLDWWADRLRLWSNGRYGSLDATFVKPESDRAVFVYFANKNRALAPFDAAALARRLGVQLRSRQLA